MEKIMYTPDLWSNSFFQEFPIFTLKRPEADGEGNT